MFQEFQRHFLHERGGRHGRFGEADGPRLEDGFGEGGVGGDGAEYGIEGGGQLFFA